MSKHSVIERAVDPDLFLELIAEAWLNPALAEALKRDKRKAIVDFAADHELRVPEGDDIDAFELPENPAGDMDVVIPVEANTPPPTGTGCQTNQFCSHHSCGCSVYYCSQMTCPTGGGSTSQAGCSNSCYTNNGCTHYCPPRYGDNDWGDQGDFGDWGDFGLDLAGDGGDLGDWDGGDLGGGYDNFDWNTYQHERELELEEPLQ
jgi:hypothetical protein